MRTHTVQAGETLGIIARHYYGDPMKYLMLAEVNHLANPDSIAVGQVLNIPQPGESLEQDTDMMTPDPADFPIDKTTMRLPPEQYVPETKTKNLIVLHFTAGSSARSAFNCWMADKQRVATAYILDNDGVIYEAFDPSQWAYALGHTSKNLNNEHRAIQIEIANVGPLKREGDYLNWWPKEFGTRYCHISETDKYVQSSFRGHDYYATFPDVQMNALADLCSYLCAGFDIPKTIPPAAQLTLNDTSFFASYEGIASHQNFRADKFDVGPGFDWERFESLLG